MAACGSGQQLREDALVDFLAKNGGRVQNKELVERFKTFINDPEPQLKAKYRDIFKDIVNRIAVVKHEDGEKYIVLKKKYRHLVHEKDSSSSNKEKNTSVQATFEKMLESEQPVYFGKDKQTSSFSDVHQFMQKSQNETSEISTSSNVNLCEWITQDVPTSDTISKAPLEITNDSQGNPRLGSNEATGERQDERFDVSKNNAANSVNIEIKVEEAQEEEFDSVFKEELEQIVFEDGSGSMGSPSVALDPLEKEWLKCAAIGHLATLSDLLRQDPSLAMKKDFTSGFTALHWAAKHGKENMARMLINAGVDINLRAHGGYTPLHIAALHSHLDIMDLLIHNYGAKTNVRDYSGRFASHYLKDNDDSTDCSNISSKFQQSRGGRRNRKLAGLFLPKSYGSNKKNWGSVENLTTDDKDGSIFLSVPTSYKAVRKFSR